MLKLEMKFAGGIVRFLVPDKAEVACVVISISSGGFLGTSTASGGANAAWLGDRRTGSWIIFRCH